MVIQMEHLNPLLNQFFFYNSEKIVDSYFHCYTV